MTASPNQDPEALASLYHDAAEFLTPGFEPAEGREAIKDRMQGPLNAGAQSLDIEPLEANDYTIE
jgi:ketosteroid isomerase-like protein